MVEIVSTTEVIVNGSTAVSGLRISIEYVASPPGATTSLVPSTAMFCFSTTTVGSDVVDGHELVVGCRGGLSERILDEGGDDIVDLVAGIPVGVRDRELAAVGAVGVDHLADEGGAVVGDDRGTGCAGLVAGQRGVEIEGRVRTRRRRSGS